MEFIKAVIRHKEAGNFFFKNDLQIIIDIMIREIENFRKGYDKQVLKN